MKKLFAIHYPLFAAIALAMSTAASEPVEWKAKPGDGPAAFVRHRGAALDFRCTFAGFGAAFDEAADVRLWYQTNGMGSAWWSVPAARSNNVLAATWPPAADPGADRVAFFFGAPSNAYASAVVRLQSSPGGAPNVLPPPVQRLDLAAVEISNAPWPTFEDLAAATNELAAAKADRGVVDALAQSVQSTSAAIAAARDKGDLAVYDAVPLAYSAWTIYRYSEIMGETEDVTDRVAQPEWREIYPDGEVYDESISYWIPRCISGEAPGGPEGFGEPGALELSWSAYPSQDGEMVDDYTPIARYTAVRTVTEREYTPTSDRLATTNQLVESVSAVAQSIASVSNAAAAAALNADTALRLVLGESVWFLVTNYMRTVEGVVPSLELWEARDGATNLVYSSKEEITNLVHDLIHDCRTNLEATVAAAVSEMPSKDWGRYQSGGADNPQPGEVTIVNSPTVILTGGGEFNKYVEVGDSSIWVLASNGVVGFGGDTNGNFLAVRDDEGTVHFKVAKTDSYDLPAILSDILPRQSSGAVLIYAAATNRHGGTVSSPPVLSAATDLRGTWYEEAGGEVDALGLSVSWAYDASIPAWVATVAQDEWAPQLFLRAKVTQEGGVAIINTAPTRFDGGIMVDGLRYSIVPYTSGGKTYLTLEAAP